MLLWTVLVGAGIVLALMTLYFVIHGPFWFVVYATPCAIGAWACFRVARQTRLRSRIR